MSYFRYMKLYSKNIIFSKIGVFHCYSIIFLSIHPFLNSLGSANVFLYFQKAFFFFTELTTIISK